MTLTAPVQKDHGFTVLGGADHLIVQTVETATGFSRGQGLTGQLHGFLLAEPGDAGQIRAAELALGVEAHGKGQGAHAVSGVRIPAEEALVSTASAEAAALAAGEAVHGGGTEVLKGGQHAQELFAVPLRGEDVEEIDAPQQQHQQHRDRDHGGDGEFFLQRPDHLPSSSV